MKLIVKGKSSRDWKLLTQDGSMVDGVKSITIKATAEKTYEIPVVTVELILVDIEVAE